MNFERFQLPNIIFDKVFKAWQITGIKRFLNIWNDLIKRNSIFADRTGLSKIIIIFGFLLYIYITGCLNKLF